MVTTPLPTTQSPKATQAIVALYVYVPVGLVLAVGVVVYFFKIENEQPAANPTLS